MPFSIRVKEAKSPAGPIPTTTAEGDEETSGKETGVQVFFTSSPTKSLTLKFILISDRLASILFLRIFIPDTFPLAIPHLDDALLLIVFSSKAS